MDNNRKRFFAKYSFVTFILGLGLLVSPALASAATITFSPDTGTFTSNKPFTVAVVVDEKTDNFNAAQANVTLSNNLTVSDMVIGDCGFSFVKTPSQQDLSFVGVILGGSKKNCTAYTLTVIPTGTQNASISLNNASVKRSGDAAELLTGVGYATYKIGAASITDAVTNALSANSTNQVVPVTQTATTINPEKNLTDYTVAVRVVDSNNKPQANVEVTLNPQLQAGNVASQTVTTDADGVARFVGVDPSIYTVRATQNNKLLAQQIINANGSSPVLTLGLQQEKSKNPLPLIVGIIGIVVALLLFFRRRLLTFFSR